jgi:hypothetical protein
MRIWPRPLTRKALVIYAAAGLSLFMIGLMGVATLAESTQYRHAIAWREAGTPAPSPSASPTPPAVKTITLSAVGDIIMGKVGGGMPANGGRDFFAQVKHLLPADLVMGNMGSCARNAVMLRWWATRAGMTSYGTAGAPLAHADRAHR